MIRQRTFLISGFLLCMFGSANPMGALAQACLCSCCATCCAQFIANVSASLVQATWKHDEEGVRRALRHGAKPNYVDEATGYTPLAIACEQGNVKILQILVQQGANVNFVIPAPDGQIRHQNDEAKDSIMLRGGLQKWVGYTPLQIAAASGKLECMEKLIALGADDKVTTIDGKTINDLYEEYCQNTLEYQALVRAIDLSK
jgi:hypothetical protein